MTDAHDAEAPAEPLTTPDTAPSDRAVNGERPRCVLLAQEVVSLVGRLAAAPPLDMAGLADGVPLADLDVGDVLARRAMAAEELADLHGYIDQRTREGEVTWYDLLARAYAEVDCAEPGRGLRRALVGLAAYAVWWAEAIETRPTTPPRRPTPAAPAAPRVGVSPPDGWGGGQ